MNDVLTDPFFFLFSFLFLLLVYSCFLFSFFSFLPAHCCVSLCAFFFCSFRVGLFHFLLFVAWTSRPEIDSSLFLACLSDRLHGNPVSNHIITYMSGFSAPNYTMLYTYIYRFMHIYTYTCSCRIHTNAMITDVRILL